MKLFIRAFVVVLALTGAVSTSLAGTSSASAKVTVGKTSAMPVPSCPPDDPNACGIVQP